MNNYYIVAPPHSEKLWSQSWFYECIPYQQKNGIDSYLVPEHHVLELFGRFHPFPPHNERTERLYDNYGYNINQYRIEFTE